jgi:two-component sensor histidine kinase
LKPLLTYLLLSFCLVAQGQDYEVSLKHWGMNDGLSDRQVNNICQDGRGFLWLCTRNGLNFFDGYNFKTYTRESNGLPFNYLYKAVEDGQGDIWVMGTELLQTNNLFIFRPGENKVLTLKDKTGYKEAFKVSYLEKFNDSTLFFGSVFDQFFFTWQPAMGFKKIAYPITVGASVAVTDNNSFWVQGKDNELYEISMQGKLLQKAHTARPLAGMSPCINTTVVYKRMKGSGNSYRATTNVVVHNGEAVLESTYPNYTKVLCDIDMDSVLFDQGKLYHPSKGMIKDMVKNGNADLGGPGDIKLAGNGKLWIGTCYGLYLLEVSKTKFHKYFNQHPDSFANNSYRNIIADNNKLYAINESGPVKTVKLGHPADTLSADMTDSKSGHFTLVKTSRGDFISFQKRKLCVADSRRRKWQVAYTTAEPCPEVIWKVYETTRDHFLLGSFFGLSWFDRSKLKYTAFTQYNEHNELKNATVIEIKKDNTGQLWLCSNTGFYQYDDKKGIVARYSSADSSARFLPAKEFNSFYQDNEGIYWLTTNSGLIRWDKARNSYKLYDRQAGLSNEVIYAAYDDNKGKVWMSSNHGIMELNKATGQVKTYLVDDGLTNNEFNRVSHTSDEEGNIYFGGLNGVTAFNPKDFPERNDSDKNAPLSVSAFEQFDGAANRLVDKTAQLLQTGKITLNPGDRFFNLNFALLTYNDVLRNTYYWKIDGLDTAWTAMREPTLRMSGLPYGSKTLHIKAQASDGSWGRNELSFEINVIKPLYLRGWFIGGCVLLIIALVGGWYRWRVTSLRKENERLDAIVKEKTAELKNTIEDLEKSSEQKDILMKEIHHRVKNNLQIISTLLNLQLKRTQDKDGKRSIEEGISRIGSIALIHHHLYKGDDITSIELRDFITELLEQVSSVYNKEDQHVDLFCDIPKTMLDIDTALPLGLILNELMTNSYKYAFITGRDHAIHISISLDAGLYIMAYADNGPGLPDNYDVTTMRSLGVVIIKNLAAQLGGSFSYNRAGNNFIIAFQTTAVRRH